VSNSPDLKLKNWLVSLQNYQPFKLKPLAGDASFRRYYRLEGQERRSYIVMDASAEVASCTPFVAIANAMRQKGLLAPEIIAQDQTLGYLLLTDFGDQHILTELNPANAKSLYSIILAKLAKLQQCQKISGWTLPNFTAEFMLNELTLWQEWFLEKYLGLTLSSATKNMLADCYDFLVMNACLQPQVFMHRDFHSANLLLLPKNEIGILDFQDAFIGPVTYDAVSLLRDCYIDWPASLVQELVLHYWELLALPNVSADEFLRWFDLMGMQRHLKALLTFSRKFCRDGDSNYLKHIPRTVNYIQTVGQQYPECQELANFLQEAHATKCAV
jgi:aminoglycoside/choline kinase family phosphotransferase